MPEVQTISLYRYSGSKALIQPFGKSDWELFQHVSNPHLQKALKTLRNGDCCRLKFQSQNIWSDHQGASVLSRQVFLDLVKAMQRQHMQLLCCADLNIVGASAGTFFFQKDPEDRRTQLACLQLGHVDKVRIVQLPESEIEAFGRILSTNWKYGVSVNNKYGLRGYKLNGRPWMTMETSNSKHIDACKLVISMLRYMESNGWSRVVPFDCTTSDYDADSLLFFRDGLGFEQPKSEFCAVALERMHKIRLIGSSDEVSRSAFESAVRKHWRSGVSETNNFQDSRQIKCVGRPWYPHTTEENIASAKLVCGVLQELWSLGWRWHCAIDMSVSVEDKSTFFLSRNNLTATSDDGSQIGCLQPKGSGKVNIVSFPKSILQRVIVGIQRKNWNVPLLKIEMHGDNCATVKFQCENLHRGCSTNQMIRTDKIYTDLLTIVGGSSEGVTILGSADISGQHSSSNDSMASSLDTDAFFFSFATSGGAVPMTPEVRNVNRNSISSGAHTPKTFLVTIPPNIYPGMQFTVNANGQRFMVTCPPDAGPNRKVRIIPPPPLSS